MYALETMEIEILKHLYERGILDINGGWEKQSKLDNVALDILNHAGLVEKSIFEGLVRLSLTFSISRIYAPDSGGTPPESGVSDHPFNVFNLLLYIG